MLGAEFPPGVPDQIGGLPATLPGVRDAALQGQRQMAVRGRGAGDRRVHGQLVRAVLEGRLVPALQGVHRLGDEVFDGLTHPSAPQLVDPPTALRRYPVTGSPYSRPRSQVPAAPDVTDA